MSLKSTFLGLNGSMIVICLVGLVASAVPAIVYTDPFWGVRGFMGKEPFAPADSQGVIITDIDSGSTAASAGLRDRDRLLTVNGVLVEFGNFRQLLGSIQPGEPVILEVIRSEQDVPLVTKGEIPAFDGMLFLDWQFASAPVFLVLLLVSIATQPLKPPPLWRALLATLGGLAVTVSVEATQWAPWTPVWRSKSISHGFPPVLHYTLTGAALLSGLALSFLGAFAVRAVLMRRRAEPVSPNPLAKSE